MAQPIQVTSQIQILSRACADLRRLLVKHACLPQHANTASEGSG